jgi:hypothetical protein
MKDRKLVANIRLQCAFINDLITVEEYIKARIGMDLQAALEQWANDIDAQMMVGEPSGRVIGFLADIDNDTQHNVN